MVFISEGEACRASASSNQQHLDMILKFIFCAIVSHELNVCVSQNLLTCHDQDRRILVKVSENEMTRLHPDPQPTC